MINLDTYLDSKTSRFTTAFKKADLNNDGFLSKSEVDCVLKELRVWVGQSEMNALLETMGFQNSDKISLNQFLDFTSKRVSFLFKVFSTMDSNNSGTIEKSELSGCWSKLGLDPTEEEISTFFTSVDRNKDNLISFDEFMEFTILFPSIRVNNLYKIWHDSLINYDSQSCSMNKSHKLLDGAVAGITSRTITAPVDRLRIVMQAASAETQSMGVLETFSWIGRTGGFRGYWLGNGANCVKIAPDQAIMYATFSRLKEALTKDPEHPTSTEQLLAGGISGTFTSYCVYPLDRARVAMAAANPGTYNGLLDVLTQNARQGLRSMYFGVSTSAIGNFPFCACQLGMAEMLKEMFCTQKDGHKPPMFAYLLSGSIASSFALTCTYPIWLLRVKMQTNGMPGAESYTGVSDCISKTWHNGGVRALYRGLVPSLAKVVPANAISYAVYKYLECI